MIQCSGIYDDKDGKYVTKQPEYETVWAHGGNCGIDDLDVIARLDFLDDNFGVDTMDTGATVGVAMEAGMIPFGDGPGAIRLVEEIGKGTPLGRILGCGAEVTGKVFGVERVPVVKGQALPAYDPRSVMGIGVTYATTTQGADHTAGYAVAPNILKSGGDLDPLKPEGQVEMSRNLQIATAAVDSTGMCLFIAFALLDQPETFQALLDMISAFHGITTDGGRRDGAREEHPQDGKGLQHPRRLHEAPRPAAAFLPQGADPAPQHHLPGDGRRSGQGFQLVARRGAIQRLHIAVVEAVMRITVKLFATFRKGRFDVEVRIVPPGSTVSRSSKTRGCPEARSGSSSSTAATSNRIAGTVGRRHRRHLPPGGGGVGWEVPGIFFRNRYIVMIHNDPCGRYCGTKGRKR